MKFFCGGKKKKAQKENNQIPEIIQRKEINTLPLLNLKNQLRSILEKGVPPKGSQAAAGSCSSSNIPEVKTSPESGIELFFLSFPMTAVL